MSDTPRTDAVVHPFIGSDGVSVEECDALLTLARQLERELAAAQIGAARYEYLRRLNPREYQDMWKECMRNNLNFDAEVDRSRIPT